MKTVIRTEPNKDLLRVLTVLEIEWDLSVSGNGDGNWALIKLDDETDQRLLVVWEQLTTLLFQYVEAMQYNQLPLWEEGGADG